MTYTDLGVHNRILILLTVFLAICQDVFTQNQITSPNQDGFESSLYEKGLTETPERDTTVVQREVPKDYTQWQIVTKSPLYNFIEPDTLQYMFQNSYKTEGLRSSYSILGNIGSPRLSRIFSERNTMTEFIFDTPYDYFIKNPTDFLFTDTKTPHLNVTYFSGGGRRNGDDRVKGYFTANFGKKVGIGFNLDYVYGRGKYANQGTSLFDARFYGYYHGDVYSAHFSFNTDDIKVTENGGIANDLYITNPELMSEGKRQYDPEEIPVIMSNTWNYMKRDQFLVSQDIALRKSYLQTDSIGDTVITFTRFREIGKFANNTEFGFLDRRFIAYQAPDNYYQYQWFRNDTIDHFKNFYINNTLSFNMDEGFSKWAVAGLRLFAAYEFRSYTMADTLADGARSKYERRENQYDFTIGGSLQRETGKNLNFGVEAQTVLFGSNFADFNIDGNISLKFNLLKQLAGFTARMKLNGNSPVYYMSHYHSQHYWWDNDFKKEITSHIEGEINIDRLRTRLSFGLTNISNYTYLADIGLPVNNDMASSNIQPFQCESEIQVMEASLFQDFVLGPLHWDNRVTWQYSSNQDVLPLPTLDIFTNLYLKFTYAKRLRIEIGGDAFWFTKYNAPTYTPATGLFNIQNEYNRIEVGGYPSIDVYINCVLRGVRLYAMLSHVNSGMNAGNGPFWEPHYPMNPMMFRFGVSWTFFD